MLPYIPYVLFISRFADVQAEGNGVKCDMNAAHQEGRNLYAG